MNDLKISLQTRTSRKITKQNMHIGLQYTSFTRWLFIQQIHSKLPRDFPLYKDHIIFYYKYVRVGVFFSPALYFVEDLSLHPSLQDHSGKYVQNKNRFIPSLDLFLDCSPQDNEKLECWSSGWKVTKCNMRLVMTNMYGKTGYNRGESRKHPHARIGHVQ